MSLPHQKFREIVYLLLFSQSKSAEEKLDTYAIIMEQLKVSKTNMILGEEKAVKIRAVLPEIDKMIQKVTIAYDLDRIQAVEKTALRLGIYEMFFEKEIPPKAAITESLRLTKKFGTPAATAFVNAILDALYKLSLGESFSKEEIKNSVETLKKSEEHAAGQS